MKANLGKAAALFQAPLSKTARLAAALQEKREKEGVGVPADPRSPNRATDGTAAYRRKASTMGHDGQRGKDASHGEAE
jgi:hypothetical protein